MRQWFIVLKNKRNQNPIGARVLKQTKKDKWKERLLRTRKKRCKKRRRFHRSKIKREGWSQRTGTGQMYKQPVMTTPPFWLVTLPSQFTWSPCPTKGRWARREEITPGFVHKQGLRTHCVLGIVLDGWDSLPVIYVVDLLCFFLCQEDVLFRGTFILSASLFVSCFVRQPKPKAKK